MTATTHGIPESHTSHHGTNYGDVWSALNSTDYLVLDEDGNNVANGRVRHLLGKYWLYVDDTDGYQILDEDAVETLFLQGEE